MEQIIYIKGDGTGRSGLLEKLSNMALNKGHNVRFTMNVSAGKDRIYYSKNLAWLLRQMINLLTETVDLDMYIDNIKIKRYSWSIARWFLINY